MGTRASWMVPGSDRLRAVASLRVQRRGLTAGITDTAHVHASGLVRFEPSHRQGLYFIPLSL